MTFVPSWFNKKVTLMFAASAASSLMNYAGYLMLVGVVPEYPAPANRRTVHLPRFRFAGSIDTKPRMRWPSFRFLRVASLLSCLALTGCGPWQLLSYWIHPNPPSFDNGSKLVLTGLRADVQVTQRADGLWRIAAQNEIDAMRAQGYLVARDRMFQLDLFRHMARGELAALLGDRQLGEKSTVQSDVLNRALGFVTTADEIIAATSSQEREVLAAYVDGINAWIAEKHLSLEHRLLAAPVRSWEAADSISIYLLLMHNLSGNADREMRRLRVACEVGLDAMQQVFPTDVLFGGFALPPDAVGAEEYEVASAIAPELRQELPALCEQGRAQAPAPLPASALAPKSLPAPPQVLALFSGLNSWSASNNWVVSGRLSKSGKPVLSSDPHLPHMNPPILWGIEIETPDNHVAGFAIPGLHRVVFGHNGHVAWGATTNHVDRQDLVVHRRRLGDEAGHQVEGYETEDGFVPFQVQRLRIAVKDGEAVEVAVRFAHDGPLLNDVEPQLAGKIPLTALRVATKGEGHDLDGAARINHARSIDEFIAGISMFDQGCSNWVFADDQGGIGYRSPCHLPIRRYWRGTFPVPGWLRRYHWDGYVPKEQLPASTNPKRGWIATANSDIVPENRFFTAYNNDSSAPWRLSRIMSRVQAEAVSGVRPESSAAIQLDLFQPYWPMLRFVTSQELCEPQPDLSAEEEELHRLLCNWKGQATAASVEATVFNLWSNAVLDRALADVFAEGAASPTWHYVQTLPQFESVAQWLWTREEDDRVWDNERTPEIERRADILLAALRDANAEGRRRWGDFPQHWQWGERRPFVLRHAFASADGVLGYLLNSPRLRLGGDNESVFKQQYLRSDRQRMIPAIGPVGRFTIDMAEPWKATYTLAGGESGWPQSPFYANLLRDWGAGAGRELTPSDPGKGAVRVTFVPHS